MTPNEHLPKNLKSDVIGVDEVVLGADNASLRIAKFTDVGVQDLNVQTSDEIAAHSAFRFVRF